MKLREQIIKARKKQGYTQISLASEIGVRQATISEFESGKRSLRFDILEKLLQTLEIRVKMTFRYKDYLQVAADLMNPIRRQRSSTQAFKKLSEEIKDRISTIESNRLAVSCVASDIYQKHQKLRKMKNLLIEITDQVLFNNAEVEVSANFTNSSYFEGHVMINDREFDGQHGYEDFKEEFGFIIRYYDVTFDDGIDSESKGFDSSKEECIDYIKTWNGTDHSYFADFKKGIVQVVQYPSGDVIHEEEVR